VIRSPLYYVSPSNFSDRRVSVILLLFLFQISGASWQPFCCALTRARARTAPADRAEGGGRSGDDISLITRAELYSQMELSIETYYLSLSILFHGISAYCRCTSNQ